MRRPSRAGAALGAVLVAGALVCGCVGPVELSIDPSRCTLGCAPDEPCARCDATLTLLGLPVDEALAVSSRELRFDEDFSLELRHSDLDEPAALVLEGTSAAGVLFHLLAEPAPGPYDLSVSTRARRATVCEVFTVSLPSPDADADTDADPEREADVDADADVGRGR